MTRRLKVEDLVQWSHCDNPQTCDGLLQNVILYHVEFIAIFY